MPVLVLVEPPSDVLPPVVHSIATQPLPLGTQRLHDALQHSSFASQTAAPHLVPPVLPPAAALPPVAGAPPAFRAPPVPEEQWAS